MDQLSFLDTEYGGKRKQTHQEQFLAEMGQVIPRERLERLIEPHYPKAGSGRHPCPLATVLRIHSLQQQYRLSDPAAKDALYEITPVRQFEKRLLTHKRIPDTTTILNFHRLLEDHKLSKECKATWHIVMKRGKQKQIKGTERQACRSQRGDCEKAKAGIRALVEYPLCIINRQFGHRKRRYCGLEKNTAQLHALFALFALSNLYVIQTEPMNDLIKRASAKKLCF